MVVTSSISVININVNVPVVVIIIVVVTTGVGVYKVMLRSTQARQWCDLGVPHLVRISIVVTYVAVNVIVKVIILAGYCSTISSGVVVVIILVQSFKCAA